MTTLKDGLIFRCCKGDKQKRLFLAIILFCLLILICYSFNRYNIGGNLVSFRIKFSNNSLQDNDSSSSSSCRNRSGCSVAEKLDDSIDGGDYSQTDTVVVTDSNRGNLVGRLWPIVDETEDRIEDQIAYMAVYRDMKKNERLPTKVILRVGDTNFEEFVEGRHYFKDCPINQCLITFNRSFVPGEADALLISQISWSARKRLLPKPSRQIWIAQHWESAAHNRIDTDSVRDLINWTASYRRDSTIPVNYGQFGRTLRNNSADPVKNYASGRTKLVAWMVSNCHAKNNRKEYALELSRYIQVDIYGSCNFGKLSCSREGNNSCRIQLKRDYKFFLAFENSNCKDYITEKLYYQSFDNDLIPVVMGARKDDYVARAPANSFIYVDDFNGPSDLANYLHLLNSNDTLYNEYFRWKGTVQNIDEQYWCRMCMMLHLQNDDQYVHWYRDYSRWWNVCSSSENQFTERGVKFLVLNIILALFLDRFSLANL